MSNRLLKQEEIDALLNARLAEPALPEEGEYSGVQQPGGTGGNGAGSEQLGANVEMLTEEEKDALGEIGNICMGSAATTLSVLLNQTVSITSPRVTITTMEEFVKSFTIPHMTIYVRFTEGLSGYNLLFMKLRDAAVMADLMMGGDGSQASEDLTEISISAASEAMNQMIGTASTSMAAMIGRPVNISPPETRIVNKDNEARAFDLVQEEHIVVVWFKMTIGNILDTQIMQVMGINTAKEEANFILNRFLQVGSEEEPSLPEDYPSARPDAGEAGRIDEAGEDFAASLFEDFSRPEPDKEAERLQGPPAWEQEIQPPAGAAARPGTEPLTAPAAIDQRRLDLILDIPLKVTVILGRTRWPIKDILGLTPGSVVELQNLVDEPVEVLVNGVLVAFGEVVVVNENFGVRITSIIGPEERLQNLRR
ncbi:MAG: flagellar motor switch phosphatase FliY [Pelotomaculum sp.]|nr:flagellar motor switch phosphatase FliY [Pelotomaculum sp.]